VHNYHFYIAQNDFRIHAYNLIGGATVAAFSLNDDGSPHT